MIQVQLYSSNRSLNFRPNNLQNSSVPQRHATYSANFKSINPKIYQIYFMGKLSALEKLPVHVKEAREATIKEAIDFITSKAFMMIKSMVKTGKTLNM